MPKPYVPCMENVEAFLANESIEVSPINVAEPLLEEPLQVLRGPIPTALILQPLGSNIQHILEDIDFGSEDTVGMQDDNLGHLATNEKAAKVPTKPLSPIPETGVTSHTETPNRPQRPRTSKVSSFEVCQDKALRG